MTWEQFVDSKYNKFWYEINGYEYYEFEIINGEVVYKEFDVYEEGVVGYMYVVIPSDKIKESGQYYAD